MVVSPRTTVEAGDNENRFVLVSGKPLGEPVAWQGPIVMITRQELQQGFREFQAGTFIKHAGPRGPRLRWRSTVTLSEAASEVA